MRRNLYRIIQFAESPVDSLHSSITNTYGNPSDERITAMASIIYGWILRAEQRWWQHPRWHVWHWRFQVHPWQALRRRYRDKCYRCGQRGFAKGEDAMGDWSETRIWHRRCDNSAAAVAITGGACG